MTDAATARLRLQAVMDDKTWSSVNGITYVSVRRNDLVALMGQGAGVDWTGGRAWPDMLEHVAQYWAECEEERAGRGVYQPEELAEDAGEFAAGLADYMLAASPPPPEKNAAADALAETAAYLIDRYRTAHAGKVVRDLDEAEVAYTSAARRYQQERRS